MVNIKILRNASVLRIFSSDLQNSCIGTVVQSFLTHIKLIFKDVNRVHTVSLLKIP